MWSGVEVGAKQVKYFDIYCVLVNAAFLNDYISTNLLTYLLKPVQHIELHC